VLINSSLSYYIAFGGFKKKIVTLGVIFNLFILAFFKYSSLISVTFFNIHHSIGNFLISIPLPIGISFFTFEGISLLIDVYRSDKLVEEKMIVDTNLPKHIQKSLFFIVFFPHLVAGPILKANDFFSQIQAKKIIEVDFVSSFRFLVTGFFLKMVIADNLKEFTYWIADPYFKTHDTITLVSMLIGYSCQIFADFAGYSLIAIGLALLLGYKLPQNFNFPYVSVSFKDFWKRWHISLSSFLMNYLYIPMGGNRKGKLKMYIYLFLTMAIGGLWHGAGWSFLVWGAFHGILLIIERLVPKVANPNLIYRFFKRNLVFLCVTLAWLLFKLTNFSDALSYLIAIFTNYDLQLNWQICINILIYCIPVFMYHFFYLIKDYLFVKNIILRFEYVYIGIMLFLIFTNSGISGEFIYFQF